MIDIAWPVVAYECAASKAMDKELDCLAEAILSFYKIGIADPDTISQNIRISTDLVKHIISLLAEKNLIMKDLSGISPEGQAYFKRTEEILFLNQKDFGYMIQNPFDGDIMPYFIKGQLPLFGGFPETTAKLSPEYDILKDSSSLKDNKNALTDAYKQYCKIFDASKNIDLTDEYNHIKTEFIDTTYENVDDDSQVRTLADAIQEERIKKAQIEVLKEEGQGFYVLC
ncbi:MAG TPA: hypothetical protein DF409_11160, partial [Bacteroidales bacterium]|nr:hypothetical protein [Bacteroidales bacterium]